MIFSLALMMALVASSVGAFSLFPFAPAVRAANAATTSSVFLSAFSPESSTSMPVAEDKMPFYALGLNLAMQAGGDGFKELLAKDELEIALEAFCTNMRRNNHQGQGQQQPQYDTRAILTTYGEELNKVLKERSGQIAGRIKKDGQFFVDSYLSSYPAAYKTASGLVYHEITAGTGASPTIMNAVEAHYHGTLTDGTVFDSSVERGQPITFPLNGVIPGWTEGLQLMKEGGKATFVIPSDLAYGDEGSGPVIPPGATLKFDVELFKVLDLDTVDEFQGEETEVIELPDGTKMRVPKGVKVRIVDNEDEQK